MTPQARNRLKYYSYLAESSSDTYDKPWLSPVSASECVGAAGLGDVVQDEPELSHEGRSQRWASSIVPAMGHLFSGTLACTECNLSWADHQRLQSFCDKYVEPRNAPREDRTIQQLRVDRFNEIFGQVEWGSA